MSMLPWTALTVGLLGGVHCIAMCGGVVSAYTLTRQSARPPVQAQLLFNFGRITSYALAGALAGGVSASGIAAAKLLPIQTMLFVVANGLLILMGLYLAGQSTLVPLLERGGARLWPVMRSLLRRLPDTNTAPRQFAAGMAWGWTPCGLVYSMLSLALLSGSAGAGALVMAAFGAGTLPNVLGAGWLMARFRLQLKQPRLRMAAGAIVAGFGVIGLLRIPGLADYIREGLLCITG